MDSLQSKAKMFPFCRDEPPIPHPLFVAPDGRIFDMFYQELPSSKMGMWEKHPTEGFVFRKGRSFEAIPKEPLPADYDSYVHRIRRFILMFW